MHTVRNFLDKSKEVLLSLFSVIITSLVFVLLGRVWDHALSLNNFSQFKLQQRDFIPNSLTFFHIFYCIIHPRM